MSGIFMPVWCKGAETENSPFKPSKGGPSHVTLCYSGGEVKVPELVTIASNVLAEWATKTITIDRVKVNTFTPKGEPERHDVWMIVCDKDAKALQKTRETYMSSLFSNDKVFMRDFHITSKIHTTWEAADAHAKAIFNALPLEVEIIGVTID
ncbi:MAG: hypothetical protein JKY23_04425 [Nitrospinaceae bacterium]|nr:hypothetical protein [Nitrospinaceae bacterium]